MTNLRPDPLKRAVAYAKSFFALLNKRYPADWDKARYVCEFYGETSERPANPSRVVFMSDGTLNIGGMADRLKGILTAYCECKRHGRQFYINWIEPFRLTDYLLPADHDWRIEPEDICRDAGRVFPAIIEEGTARQNMLRRLIFRAWFIFKPCEMHIFSNLKWHEKYYGALYRELFRPSERLSRSVNCHIAAAGGRYYSFSFRFHELLGDFRDIIGIPLPKEEAERLMDKNISELKRLLESLPAGCCAYVASDSSSFLERVVGADSRIYVVPKKIIHMGIHKSDEGNDDIWLNTFTDFYMIMNAERVYLLKTGDMYCSGFPQLAAALGGKEFVLHEF